MNIYIVSGILVLRFTLTSMGFAWNRHSETTDSSTQANITRDSRAVRLAYAPAYDTILFRYVAQTREREELSHIRNPYITLLRVYRRGSLLTIALSLLRCRKMPADVSFPPYTVLPCTSRQVHSTAQHTKTAREQRKVAAAIEKKEHQVEKKKVVVYIYKK